MRQASPEDTVYDLSEFAAVELSQSSADDEDRIYELTELGAVEV